MDMMRAVNGYAFLVCACGLKMKLPPDLESPAVTCPRCGRENRVPAAELAAAGAVIEAVTTATEAGSAATGAAPSMPQARPVGERYEYARKGTGWESFSCACGNTLQLSPAFRGTVLNCRLCGRNTVIK
jgi:heat shock protein HtpX